ncbi:DinB family protein [Streptomyces sp. NPDC059340]|uniref:DinB family protein n=1 Tax=Streptomyces sp. NPDC059340 TaxID=3346806 RepID=UPI003691DE4B
MRPDDTDGFREAWAILERLWEGTVVRARTFPEAVLHRSIDDEWSFIQTLRHLNFASAAWVGRMILGDAAPWHQLDLPWDEAPGWDGIPTPAPKCRRSPGCAAGCTRERAAGSHPYCPIPGFPDMIGHSEEKKCHDG